MQTMGTVDQQIEKSAQQLMKNLKTIDVHRLPLESYRIVTSFAGAAKCCLLASVYAVLLCFAARACLRIFGLVEAHHKFCVSKDREGKEAQISFEKMNAEILLTLYLPVGISRANFELFPHFIQCDLIPCLCARDL